MTAGSGKPGERAARARITIDGAVPAVAAALRPDDTSEVTTRASDAGVLVTVERDQLGGLARTVDDVLVNLQVAERVVETGRRINDDRDDTTT